MKSAAQKIVDLMKAGWQLRCWRIDTIYLRNLETKEDKDVSLRTFNVLLDNDIIIADKLDGCATVYKLSGKPI